MTKTEQCNYVYDRDASGSTRIVTICHHCGKTEVKELMDMWTQPPAKWMPHLNHNSMPSFPRNIILN